MSRSPAIPECSELLAGLCPLRPPLSTKVGNTCNPLCL